MINHRYVLLAFLYKTRTWVNHGLTQQWEQRQEEVPGFTFWCLWSEVFLNFNTTKVDACFINSNNRFSNKRMDECQQASYNQINASREGSEREKRKQQGKMATVAVYNERQARMRVRMPIEPTHHSSFLQTTKVINDCGQYLPCWHIAVVM